VEERLLPAVAPLRHRVGDPGNHYSRPSRHARNLPYYRPSVKQNPRSRYGFPRYEVTPRESSLDCVR
jgi:hypothetical protein